MLVSTHTASVTPTTVARHADGSESWFGEDPVPTCDEQGGSRVTPDAHSQGDASHGTVS